MKKSVILLILLLSVPLAYAQSSGDYRSKQTGNWTSASTWETYNGSEWQDAGTAPNSSSGVVTIRNGHTVTINSGNLTIDQTVVDAGGTLTVNYGFWYHDLEINNGDGDDLTVNGTLNFDGKIDGSAKGLHGSGKIVINGICNWNTGHITSSNFWVAENGEMFIGANGETRLNTNDARIYNAGKTTFLASSAGFAMYQSPTFNNMSGGIFEATTDQSIYTSADYGNNPTFNNAGTFRKKTGTGTTALSRIKFDNTGTVLVESGTLRFCNYLTGTHTGTFTIASGAKILSDYCTQNFSEGSVINGAGEFETVNNNTCNVTGTTNGTLIGPDINFKLSGTAALGGAGKLIVNGTFEWTSTGWVNPYRLIISEGANLNISGTDEKTFRANNGNQEIENYGTITWTGTGRLSGYGNIRNKSTGVFDIQNDVELGNSGSTFTITNDGLIKKSAGTGTTRFNLNTFTNNGTLQIDTGTLDLYNSTLTNYDHNSGNPYLNGGVYNMSGKFRFNATYGVFIQNNNASIILNGTESAILNNDGNNAMPNLAQNTASGSLTLRNGRDFSTGASNFTNSGTLDCGDNIFSGSGNFTNADHAWLILGSADGIVSSGSSGNIRSSGTRTFHTGGKYHYNGTSSQVTGSGLPGTVRELKIENASGVTLSSSANVASHLTLTEGALTTGSNTLTLGSSAESVGTLTRTSGKIIGNFKRWLAVSTVDDVLFPLGTADHYRPVNLSYTSAPETGGTLTASFTAGNPGSSGLPLSDGEYTVNTVSPDGYWTLAAADGLSGGTFDLDITAEGFGGIADYSTLRILKRANSESTWTLDGTHVAGTGSNSEPVLHRSGLSGFSEFGVGGNAGDNALPITLANFSANYLNGAVSVTWVTESESENAAFRIYRDGEILAELEGAGTTTEPQSYIWTDLYVIPGRTYAYQLADVSFDGKEKKHNEIEVKIELEYVDRDYSIGAAYPNPFNPVTIVPLNLAAPADVRACLYDLSGRMIRELYNAPLSAGSHALKINGEGLSTGIYFVHIVVNVGAYCNTPQVQKIALMK